jgi:hypothetical protein
MANFSGMIVKSEEGFWMAYQATTAEVPTRGNSMLDAYLAVWLHEMPREE